MLTYEAGDQARQWSKAVQIVDMQEDDVAERYTSSLRPPTQVA
jgi:hypothetical protein